MKKVLRFLMSTFVLAGAFLANVSATPLDAAGNTYRNVMYYGDWSIEDGQGNFFPKDIPADKLTHLNFAFLDFDVDGNLEWTDEFAAVNVAHDASVTEGAANAGLLNALQELRLQNPNLKIGVSVGGWTKSGDFALNAQDDAKRATLVDNLIKFVKYNEMDFLDIDWEYPGSARQADLVDSAQDEGTPDASPADRQNFITLLEDLRAGLDTLETETGKYYELSVALAAGPYTLSMGTDIPAVFDVVDFANLMTYDIHGAWENASNHHTGLYTNPSAPQGGGKPWSFSINDSVTHYLNQGVDAEKIVIGTAFYSRGWGNVENDGPDPVNYPGLFGTANFATTDADGNASRGAENHAPLVNGDGGRNGGIWPYRHLDELKEKYPDLTEYWDDYAQAPYLYSATDKVFFTYDNEASITAKTDYIKTKNLGGMITWMQSQDAPSEVSSDVRDTLTSAIFNGLYGEGTSLVTNEIETLELDITAKVDVLTTGSTEGYQIDFTNNERLVESDSVLVSSETSHKTLKNPIFYLPTTATNEVLSYEGTALETVTIDDVQYFVLDTTLLLAPGETASIRVTSNLRYTVTENISTILVAQRMLADSISYGLQSIETTHEDIARIGSIMLFFLDADRNELATAEVYTGAVGATLEYTAPTFDGYTLANEIETPFVFTNIDQTLIYTYEVTTTDDDVSLAETGINNYGFIYALTLFAINGLGLYIIRKRKQNS